jgi:hypothetical protein
MAKANACPVNVAAIEEQQCRVRKKWNTSAAGSIPGGPPTSQNWPEAPPVHTHTAWVFAQSSMQFVKEVHVPERHTPPQAEPDRVVRQFPVVVLHVFCGTEKSRAVVRYGTHIARVRMASKGIISISSLRICFSHMRAQLFSAETTIMASWSAGSTCVPTQSRAFVQLIRVADSLAVSHRSMGRDVRIERA